MAEALALADEAGALGEVPVGALVVQGDRVLGRGFNRRESWQDPTAHAEIIAIRQAAETLGSWRLEGCAVIVTLEPCSMCAGAMVLARVQHCVYGCSDPKGGFLGSLGDLSQVEGLNHSFTRESGVLADQCSKRLTEFFRKLRKPKS